MTAAPQAIHARRAPPALVMIHGFALDARMWWPQVEELSADFRMLLVDLPGFGPQAREVGVVEPAKELGRAMDVAKLQRAHLVASCYGAAVAIDYALQHPERVASLVLAAPMLLGRRLGIDSWRRCVSLAKEGDSLTAVEVLLDDGLFDSLRHDEDLFEGVRPIILDYPGGHWTGKVTSVWSEPDPLSRLKGLSIPALIISGEQDLPSFMLMAEAYAKTMPSARREVIQGVGHHVSLEAASTFNGLVRHFVASVM